MNYQNSSENYSNSPANYENSSSGKRRLITSDKVVIGYYVFAEHGVINFYNSGGRVAYMPGSGKTQSIFLSNGSGWCATIGSLNGKSVIGMTEGCILRFVADK